MPPQRTLPPVERLKFCESVIPPESWKAELTPPAMATVLLPAPRAAELAATTTPCWTVRVPSQFGLAAARTRVPISSFTRLAVGLPAKGVFSVRVLPVTTWIQELLSRLMVRLLVQVSIARKPAPPEAERRIWLAGSPRAASEVAAMKPPVFEIRLPRKVLPGLVSTREPLPSLTMSPVPVMRPENTPAWTTFEEWVALARL